MAREATAAQQLAAFAVSDAPAQVPAEVRTRIKLAIADTIACAAAGAVQSGRLGLDGVRPEAPLKGDASATMIGGRRATARQVALMNGTWTRFLDFNDTFAPRRPNTNGHFSDGTLGIFAAAESIGASGRELVDALIVSYEVQGWLAQRFRWRDSGYHAASVTPFGVALAVGRLLGCDADQLTAAAGITASTALVADTWLRPNGAVIGTIKALTAGLTSQTGILIAELAAGGATAPDDAIEEIWKRSSAAPPPHPGGAPGKEWLTLRTSIKRYPSQIYTQSVAEAAVRAFEQGARLDAARHIQIRSHDRACAEVQGSPQSFRPMSRGDADHSTPFVVATVLREGRLTLDAYDGEPWHDLEFLAAMDRVELIVDPVAQRLFTESGLHPASVRVVHRDGSQYEGAVEQFSGHPDCPLSQQQLREKLVDLIDAPSVWGSGAAERLLGHCLDIERRDGLAALTSMIGTPLGGPSRGGT